MFTTGARTTFKLAALVGAGALLLAACSSSSSSDTSSASASASALPSASAFASASAAASGAPTATASGGATTGSPTSAAGQACAAYFQLDILNSQYAGGAVKNGNMTEEQVKADFQRLVKAMAAQAKLAAADGTGDTKLEKNSVRMKKEIMALKKKQNLSDLPKDVQAKFAKQSLRVQRACDRAGYPLPTENVTARTAAGLS